MLLRLSLIISSLLCNKLQQVQVPATCSTMKTDQMPPDARVLFCKFNSQEKILNFNLIIFGEPLLLLSTIVLSSRRRRQIFIVVYWWLFSRTSEHYIFKISCGCCLSSIASSFWVSWILAHNVFDLLTSSTFQLVVHSVAILLKMFCFSFFISDGLS